eukprot:c36764_g1_i1 orf=1-204(-)
MYISREINNTLNHQKGKGSLVFMHQKQLHILCTAEKKTLTKSIQSKKPLCKISTCSSAIIPGLGHSLG